MKLQVKFTEQDQSFKPKFGEVQNIGGTTNHADLANRDQPDQHPISAIAGLEEALAKSCGQPYVLPIATPETLGGVKPTAKTEDMIQRVGVDETGGLWTMPSEGGGSGGGDNAWKLIGRTTTEEEVTDVIITSENVMNELLVRYSVPPIAEDTGGNTYAMPVIMNGSGAVDHINANVNIPKPSTKTHRRIWHIMPLGTIRQLWEAGTGSPSTEVLGITEEANLAIRSAYENGGGLVGFRLRWNVNGVFPVGTSMEVWGR